MTHSKYSLFFFLVFVFSASYSRADSANQNFKRRLHYLVGEDVIPCGTYEFEIYKLRYLPTQEISKISDCMTNAYRSNKAFYFSLQGPEDNDYNFINGMIGLPENGGVYRYSYRIPDCKGMLCNDSFNLSRCRGKYTNDFIDPKSTCNFSLDKLESSTINLKSNNHLCESIQSSLPDSFTVFGAGTFKRHNLNKRKLGLKIDTSSYEANQVDVLVNYQQTPVVLFLGAYEPTVWNISWSEKTHIASVVIGGFYRQAIAGLPPNIPIIDFCGKFYVNDNQDDLKEVDRLSNRLLGPPIKMVYLPKDGKVVVGNEPIDGTKIVTSPGTPPESFYILPAGQAGLDVAIAQGLIRMATQEDVDDWIDIVLENVPIIDMLPITGNNKSQPKILLDDHTYVALKPFKLPSNLPIFSRFFVPVGVPVPTGQESHEIIYDFNTRKCYGLAC
ncbi:hypothetical protein [Methylomonas sp. TEB]|uniref:hypothetical protein n=1 Tax=Methylomonas sp. TEB TaxID=3398229 RepID=UPI0039F51117